MGPIIFALSILVLVIVWNPFDTAEKSDNLANKMRLLSRNSVKSQQDNERAFYKAHVEEWKETPFYQFVLNAIKNAAEKGEKGVLINYYFNLNYYISKPSSEPYHYSDCTTKKGTHVIYVSHAYYFSEDENKKYLYDSSFRKAFLSGIKTYLEKEGFDVIKPDSNSLIVSW